MPGHRVRWEQNRFTVLLINVIGNSAFKMLYKKKIKGREGMREWDQNINAVLVTCGTEEGKKFFLMRKSCFSLWEMLT